MSGGARSRVFVFFQCFVETVLHEQQGRLERGIKETVDITPLSRLADLGRKFVCSLAEKGY